MTLTPERWQQLKQIFGIAIERAPQERAAYLDQACANDSALRTEIEFLLASHDHAEEFIEAPRFEDAMTVILDAPVERIEGRRIGSYQLMRELGCGGMGTVYLAHRADDEYRKLVAIKVVRRGMDTKDIVRRFRNERQILASLEHPNIARLLDGGTTEDGAPYIVMEYVEGTPIANYCDEHRLKTTERLQLFRTVCAAVQHAHQNLVVHRDLKPSNILIAPDGEPKLLDFGIAKVLNPELSALSMEQTLTELRVFTPDYASPEQARGEKLTTASDIYSLGIVLYELLTGHRPYHLINFAPHELWRVIGEQQPTKPSAAAGSIEVLTHGESEPQTTITPETVSRARDTQPDKLRRRLSGDLDNIVLKAMRKEPARRYSSAGQFAEDIRRHLEGLPVIARKDTFKYRAGKFIKRNKVGVTAASLIALTIIAGGIISVWQAHRANVQRVRAERRFNDVRRLSHSLMFEIHDSVKDLQGSTPTRQLIVTRALEYLDSLAQEAGDDPSLQSELAIAYEKVGDIQGNPYSANIGDTDGALASYRKAVRISETLSNAHATTETQMALGRSYRSLGDIFEQKGEVAETVNYYRRSLQIFDRLAAINPTDAAVQDELARAYDTLGDGLSRTSDGAAESLQSYSKSLEMRQSQSAKNPSDTKLKRSMAVELSKVGAASSANKTEAVNKIHQGITIFEELAAADPNNARARREVGYAYFQLGNVQVVAGDYAAALESRRRAFAIRQESAAQDPKNSQARFDLAAAHADLSEALTGTGETAQALDHARQSLDILEELSAIDPSNAVYRRNTGLVYEKFAQAFARSAADEATPPAQRIKDWTQARAWYQKDFELFSAMREQGTLRPSDAGNPEKYAVKMAECRNSINQLNSSSK